MPADSREVEQSTTAVESSGDDRQLSASGAVPDTGEKQGSQEERGQEQDSVAADTPDTAQNDESASSSRARSRGSPRKTNSRASIRSRATPPPKLRRRQSSAGDKNQSGSDSETTTTTGDGKDGGAAGVHVIAPVVSEIVEETPSAIKLEETVGTSKSRSSVVSGKEGADKGRASDGGGDHTPVKSAGQASNSASPQHTNEAAGSTAHTPATSSAKATASPTHSQAHYREQIGASPLDALPSSPTRSRVSAAVPDASVSGSTVGGEDGAGDVQQSMSRFLPTRVPPAQVTVQARPRQQRGTNSVELSKTMSQTAKERPLVKKAHSQRFQQTPPPEPDDSLSETKTAVIRRVQEQLLSWETQLDHIQTGRVQSDKIHKHELRKREGLIRELKAQKDDTETQRMTLDEERAHLAEQLLLTSDDLVDKSTMLDQAEDQLRQYEETCVQLEDQRVNLEAEVSQLDEELQQNEALRKRLNEQVTQLQGQLAIEEQRSKFCVIL